MLFCHVKSAKFFLLKTLIICFKSSQGELYTEQELEVSNPFMKSYSVSILHLTFGNKHRSVGSASTKSYIVEMDKRPSKGFISIVFRPANQSLRAFRRIELQMWLGHQ